MGELRATGTLTALALLVATLTWLQGGVGAVSQLLVFGAVLGAAAIVASGGRSAAAPALLAAGGLLHLAPWPAPIDPELRAALESLGAGLPATFSLTPLATARAALVFAGCCAIFLIAGWAARRGGKAVWILAGSLIALALVEALLGWRQLMESRLLDDAAGQAAHGTFVNKNHFAVLLEMAFGLAAGFAARAWYADPLNRRREPALAAGGLAVVLLAALAAAQSRMSVAVAAALIAAAICLSGDARRAGAVALALAASGGALAAVIGAGELAQRFEMLTRSGDQAARLAMWRDSALAAANQAPWGAGLGAFPSVYERGGPYLATKTLFHAHNDLLEFLVELGPFLTAALALAVGWVLARGALRVLRDRAGDQGPLIAGLLVAAMAPLLHGAVDFPLRIPALAAWFAALLGCIAGLSAPEPSRGRFRAVRAALAAPWLVCAALALWLTGEGAARLDPLERFREAETAYRSADLAAARVGLVGTLEANPRAAAAWLRLAEIEEAEGRAEEALRWTLLANRLEPYTLRTEWALAQALLRRQSWLQASEHLAHVAEGVPWMRETAYAAAWRAAMPPDLIQKKIVPADADGHDQYQVFLTNRGYREP